ncbi:molybdopterin-guanine dinucleotide biosynthesis protein B [Clostridium formicaceticum]|uniref:Molybdopterin-guanine dinucleotide biosynthesis adapter protein n=1 Tax=Clostridium formicaceticum TaxID=1497 RepID=A0AAC9WGZ2_9CLOT|nr:molybdopterin-guanine dinucleotide biosynthesis protein B [Clostridium formicaceticum]AOY77786.1 molybdopterin-guanine dinucleotide biosynthesis protein B [Clostridium formicaceticum]ARE88393.1 Molybdopterin-guanine dinucleotide biosynthesis adapter protein [Clostridium formicaceticum]
MIPVFSIVGKYSNIGKTTVLCNMIKELKARGYRVATIKHDIHGFDIDHPGKDTWKHAQAGSDVVIISSPTKFAKIEKVGREYTLDEILTGIKNVDIIIIEGYKHSDKPKLEVYRKEITKGFLCANDEMFAIVTDDEHEKAIPTFGFHETDKLVDFIAQKIGVRRRVPCSVLTV